MSHCTPLDQRNQRHIVTDNQFAKYQDAGPCSDQCVDDDNLQHVNPITSGNLLTPHHHQSKPVAMNLDSGDAGQQSSWHSADYQSGRFGSSCGDGWSEYWLSHPTSGGGTDSDMQAEYLSSFRRCKKAPFHAAFQTKVYNFLERPTGWKCFIYHFSV